MLNRSMQHNAVIHLAWLALFLVLVAARGDELYQAAYALGPWVMTYGVLVVIAGLMTAGQGFGTRLATEEVFRAPRWLFGVLRDVVFFVPFLIAGWSYRQKPEIHKRLMILATTILMLPAVG